MKKALFLFLSKMDFGGQERFASHLSEMLQNEYEVYFVLFDAETINYKIYGHVLDIKQGGLSKNPIKKTLEETKRWITLRKYFRKYKPIACISFGNGPNLLNLMAKMKGIIVIPSIRGFATAERIVSHRLDRVLYKRADKILCVSEGIKKKLNSDLPYLSDKLEVVYNAYDCDQIVCESREYKCESVNEDGGYRLVSVGTLRPEKGYWHLIKAVSILREKYPSIKLLIVGMDYADNGKKLMELVRLLHLEDNVCFEGWHQNPYVFLAMADVYVLSSVREGFPNALVEAMVCGKPVIADDCLTGPREILSPSKLEGEIEEITKADYGILTPRLDVQEDYTNNIFEEEVVLANAIDMVLSDDSISEEYSKRSLIRAKEFSYSACKDKIKTILENAGEAR